MKNKQAAIDGGEPSFVKIIKIIYGIVAVGYFLCVILQVFFAGLGLFVNSRDWQIHLEFANYFEVGSLFMFLISFFGKIRGRLRWLPLVLFVLTSLKHLTIQTFSGSLRAIHTIDALLLFGISLHLMKCSCKTGGRFSLYLYREKRYNRIRRLKMEGQFDDPRNQSIFHRYLLQSLSEA